MRRIVVLLVAMSLSAGIALAADKGTWTGEVLDLACYIGRDAKGSDHAGCAQSCVKNGQPMGLLTDDGEVVVLAADHQDGAAFEAAKELAGGRASVTGTLAESGGMKVVTVSAVEAAD